MKPLNALLILFYACLLSCSNDNSSLPIGEDFTNSNTRVLYIDTMTVKTSTFKFDSLVVSNQNRLLTGVYDDPIFGKVKSQSYIQLISNSYSIANDAMFDSIALILNYDTYFYNDTLQPQTFRLYEVLENIRPTEDNYYNTTQFDSDNNPIGSKTFFPRPNEEDSLHIKVNNLFGSTLFNKIRSNDINNSEDFLREYKGLYLEGDNENTTILSFLKDSFLRIYYSTDDEIQEEESQTLDLNFNSTNSFSVTSGDYEGTFFENLSGQQDNLPSHTANNNSFVQAGTGIATEIDVPYLEQLYEIEGSGVIVDALLKFSLNPDSGIQGLPVKDSLAVYTIDKRNDIVNNEGLYAIKLQENIEYGILEYGISLKSFLENKLADHNGHNWSLALYPVDFNNLVDRYIIYGEEAHNDVKVKLELIYAIYNE